MAVLPSELPIDSDPLAHRNLSCDIDITVAPFGMRHRFLSCLIEQDMNALPRDLRCRRIAGLLFHCLVTLLPDVVIYQRKGYKRNGDFYIPGDCHKNCEKSGNPDFSSVCHQFFFTEKPDCLGETFMLLLQDPIRKQLLIIPLQHGQPALENDRAAIETFVDEMYRAAGYLHAVIYCLLLGVQPGKAWEQCRMYIHYFSAKCVDNAGAEDAHIACKHEEIGIGLLHCQEKGAFIHLP